MIWVSGLDLGIERNHKNKSVSGIVVFVFLSRRYVCLLVRPSVPPVLVVRPSVARSFVRPNERGRGLRDNERIRGIGRSPSFPAN